LWATTRPGWWNRLLGITAHRTRKATVMATLTRFVLRHKLMVTAFWLLLAVAGALTAGSTTGRLTTSFAMPGDAFTTDTVITATYHNGAADPIVPVITLPAGQTVDTPGVRDSLARAFAAARLSPSTRVVDYASTGDRAFLSRAARSTFALVTTPAHNPMGGSDEPATIQRAVQAAAPPSWQVGVTGIQALVNTQPQSQGAGVLVESALLGRWRSCSRASSPWCPWSWPVSPSSRPSWPCSG